MLVIRFTLKMLASFVLLVVFVITFVLRLYQQAFDRPQAFPPGPPRLPLWGSYWFALRENYNFLHISFEKLANKHKTDILGLYLGNTPTIVTFSIDLCKELLTRDEFLGRNDTIVTRTRALGKKLGIFFVDGPFWKEQRRFALRHMRDYGFGRRSNIMEDLITEELHKLFELFMNDPKPEDVDVCRRKGEVLMPDIFFGPFINAILLTLGAKNVEHYKLRKIALAFQRFQRFGDVTGSALSMTPWLRYIAPNLFGFTDVKESNIIPQNFVKDLIKEHKESYIEGHHRDFIDVFLNILESLNIENEDLSTFSDDQLLLVIIDFIFPAPIAPVHTLNFYFAYLINNPKIQQKVQEEIDTVVGRCRLPNLDDRKFMPYTEASIREALRISPINPLGIPRRCVEDTYLGGYFVPKDCIMIPCVWTAHRDKSIWDKPLEFRPERFLDQNGNLMKKDITIGFGAGKRLCAGETFSRQNMFLLITGILQNFTIKLARDEKKLDTENDLIWGVNLSLRNYWIEVIPR